MLYIFSLAFSSHQYGTEKFTAVEGQYVDVVRGIRKPVKTAFQCITAMREYSSKSLEVSSILSPHRHMLSGVNQIYFTCTGKLCKHLRPAFAGMN